MADDPPREPDEVVQAPTSWWPELVDLIEHLEDAAARREGRRPRSTAEICAAIEQEWRWLP
jgi:hypothetical protein